MVGWEDNFESYTIGQIPPSPWVVYEDVDTCRVSADYAHSGTKSVKCRKTTATGYFYMHRTGENETNEKACFWIRIQAMSTLAQFRARVKQGNNNAIGLIFKNGNLWRQKPPFGDPEIVCPFTGGVFQYYEIEFDCSSHQYTIKQDTTTYGPYDFWINRDYLNKIEFEDGADTGTFTIYLDDTSFGSAIFSKELPCHFGVLHPYLEDWSMYSHIKLAFKGPNAGCVAKFRILNNENCREGELDDIYSGWYLGYFALRTLPGSLIFDWTKISGIEFEFPIAGIFRLDHIWLLGCPDLHCFFILSNAGSANLSFSMTIQATKNLPSSFNVRQRSSENLPASMFIYQVESRNQSCNMIIRQTSSTNLSGTLTVQQMASKNLSSSFTVRQPGSRSLSSSLSIRKPASKNLSANCLIYFIGSKDLSASFSIRRLSQADLSLSLNIRRPLAFIDKQVEASPVLTEVF